MSVPDAQSPATARPQTIEAVPLRHPGRWVAAAVIAVLVAMLVHSLAFNKTWQISVIGDYLFDASILRGIVQTLEFTVIAMVIGVLGGILLAVMRLSANPVLSGASWFYIWFFRGTPVIVQLVIWYNIAAIYPKLSFGIPFGPGHHVDSNSLITRFVAAILGLGLNEAAYMAEIVRAGILSVDPGQNEAAQALGMRGHHVMWRIILPQAMRVIVPPTGNETISMLKTTSLVSVIAAPELFGNAEIIAARNFTVIQLLLVASLWYLFATSILTVGQYYVERYYGRGSARTQPETPIQKLRRTLFSTDRQPRRTEAGLPPLSVQRNPGGGGGAL